MGGDKMTKPVNMYGYDKNLRYYSDVKDKFGYANINRFPNNFDVKSLNDGLNVCDRCGDICNWEQEMCWQGECEDTWHNCMGNDYVAVCDDCFTKLKNCEK